MVTQPKGHSMNRNLHDAYRQWLRGLGYHVFVTLNLNAALTANRGLVRVWQTGPSEGSITCQIAPPSRRVPTTWTVGEPQIRDLLKAMDTAIHTRLIGRHFDRRPARRRLQWVAAVESPDLNPHLHLLWRVHWRHFWRFRAMWGSFGREDIWKEIVGAGDSHVRLVEEPDIAADYMVKQAPYRRDLLILSSEFWPDWCRIV
jgi:hypothetical protein